MKNIKKIFVINPGSTSTKIGLYTNTESIFQKDIHHSLEELSHFNHINEQFEFRKKIIIDELKNNQIELKQIIAIIGRGGILKPMPSGIYRINERMIFNIKNSALEHASNLGILLAYELSTLSEISKNAFMADPPCVDEMDDLARTTGIPDISRISLFHALNQRAVAHRYAQSINKKYQDINLIVAHLGGGISIGVHQKGKVIDVNNALNGDGPFTPERAGSIPAGQLVELCFSGKFSKEEILHQLSGKGGLTAYLGTNDFIEVKKIIEAGNTKALKLYQTMAYQIAKEIGAMASVLSGIVDGIILTGGLAFDKDFTELISKQIKFIAPIIIYPGENEMDALALNCLNALNGDVEIKEYV